MRLSTPRILAFHPRIAFMTTTIATSIIAALCLAAIFAALKSRWLYVVAPKLYLNTPLSDGQIVSLTIHNAGLLAEEDVAITFRSACKFELVATSKSTLTVNGMTISVAKVSRGESVTVLLLIEGKAFDALDIDSIESKATKGKVVESKDKATALWHNFVALPILALVLGLPFLFGTHVGSQTGVSAFGYVDDKLELFGPSKQLAGFQRHLREDYASIAGALAGATTDKRLGLEIQEIVRRGDVLTAKVKITNNTGKILAVEANMNGSAGGRGPLDYSDSRIEAFMMAANEVSTIKFKVFLPESLSVKLIQGTYLFKVPAGDSLHVSETILF